MNIELDDVRSPEPAATSRLVGNRTAPTFRSIRQKGNAAVHRLSQRSVRPSEARDRREESEDGDRRAVWRNNSRSRPSGVGDGSNDEVLAAAADMEAPSSSASQDHQLQGGRAVPPPDRGRGAYLVLAACSLAQAPIWGKIPSPPSRARFLY